MKSRKEVILFLIPMVLMLFVSFMTESSTVQSVVTTEKLESDKTKQDFYIPVEKGPTKQIIKPTEATESISLPTPTFTFNKVNIQITIPEFQAYYNDSQGLHELNDSYALQADFLLVYYFDGETPTLSKQAFNLSYSGSGWFCEDLFVSGLAERTNHSIIYRFQSQNSILTNSNFTAQRFYIDHYEVNISKPEIVYDNETWSAKIVKTIVESNISEVGFFTPENTNVASWQLRLYHDGTNTATGLPSSVPAMDTQSINYIEGSLIFNDSDNSWYSDTVDIGWLPSLYREDLSYTFIVEFNSTLIPDGSFRSSFFSPIFMPISRSNYSEFFNAREHKITITKPDLVYDPSNLEGKISGIIAFQDYKNITLDQYEIYQKEINSLYDDQRAALWQLFKADGTPVEGFSGDLVWNVTTESWYANFDLSSVRDTGNYYIACKFITMNVNNETIPFGPSSALFAIQGLPNTTQRVGLPLISLLPVLIPFVFLCTRSKCKE